MNTNDIDQFINNSDDIISTTAKLAKSYKQMLAEGNITQSEYDELAKNLVDIQRLDQFALNEERKQTIYAVLKTLSAILGVTI